MTCGMHGLALIFREDRRAVVVMGVLKGEKGDVACACVRWGGGHASWLSGMVAKHASGFLST